MAKNEAGASKIVMQLAAKVMACCLVLLAMAITRSGFYISREAIKVIAEAERQKNHDRFCLVTAWLRLRKMRYINNNIASTCDRHRRGILMI